jgi:hypothetical protein
MTMHRLIVTGLLLAASWSAAAQAESAPAPVPSGEAEGNLFHEPFFQLSRKLPGCQPPRGPWWTQAEATADIHWRANSGVSCYLAGKCRLMNSYQYDDGIAERVKATFERDFRFEDSSVWAHVQRRFVTLMGCVKDASQKSALIAAMQGIDDVNQVVDQLSIGVDEAPKYTVAPADR